jgi:TatD DNase family protein
VGVHPYHVLDDGGECGGDLSGAVAEMRDLLVRHRPWCAAVGECGLDATDGFPPLDAQLPYFEAQVALAQELDMPLFVHERLAFDECVVVLDRHSVTVPVLVHCFTGTQRQCRAYVQRGCYISVSGYLFKEEAADLRQCLEDGGIPLDRLMIETDAPYMGFPRCRELFATKHAGALASMSAKKRKKVQSSRYPNMASSLPMVLSKVLEHINRGRALREEPPLSRSELALRTSRNANRFFRLGLNL